MKIIVYTAIFGTIDPLWPPLPVLPRQADYVCFTDKPRKERGYWSHQLTEDWPSIIPETGRFNNLHPGWRQEIIPAEHGNRKTARHCKTLAHDYFPDADITIWLDGNVRLMIPPRQAVKKWLGGADLAIFNHHDRNCLYREAAFCSKMGKGKRAKLDAQVKAYRKAGMPSGWGLAETKCVIRRNTGRMSELNEAWWAELQTHSVRDQVSLPYVCWRLGIKWKVIPGRAGLRTFPGTLNKAFWYAKHRKKG